MSENGEIYTAGKNFTLPPALTALTNSNSAQIIFITIITLTANAAQVTEHEVQNSVRSIPKLDTLILVKVGLF